MVVLLLSISLYSCGVFLQQNGQKNYLLSTKEYSRELNNFQHDFLYLSDLLEVGFPELETLFPEDQREIRKRESLLALDSISTYADFILTSRKYLSNVKNQHTSIYLESSFEDLFPYLVYINSDGWHVLNVDTRIDSLCIGKRITKINKIGIDNIEKRLINFTFSENKINQQHELFRFQLYNKPNYLIDIGVIKNNSDHLTIEFDDNTLIKLNAISPKVIKTYSVKFVSDSITKYRDKTYTYDIYESDNFGYLQFNRCHDKIDILDGIKSYVKPWLQPLAEIYVKNQFKKDKPSKQISKFYNPEYPVFKDFVWELIDSLNQSKIDNLIIDLRNNSGGNIVLGEQLIYFLTEDMSFKKFDEYAYTSDMYKKYFPSEYELLKTKRSLSVPDNELILINSGENGFSEIMDINSPYYVPIDRPTFKGNIYILSNYNTGSAAAMLTTLFQDNKIGITIGTSVGNNPIGATTYTPVKLPKTKAMVSIASTYIVRPDKSKGEVQIPDIWVEHSLDNLIRGEDPYLNEVLRLIKSN